MNNGMSNTKGLDIRRPIAMLLLVVFCLAVFASPAAALQYDPNNWQYVDRANPTSAIEGDEGGWIDPHQSSVEIWFIVRYSIYSPTLYWLFDILPDVDRGDDGVTNPNDQNNDPNVRPTGTTSSN